jgi:hypothetical protein
LHPIDVVRETTTALQDTYANGERSLSSTPPPITRAAESGKSCPL